VLYTEDYNYALLCSLHLVPCTAELVGLWPVSDEVSPCFPVQEQCRVFDLLQCRSSVFNSLLDIVHPSFPRSASGSDGTWFPTPRAIKTCNQSIAHILLHTCLHVARNYRSSTSAVHGLRLRAAVRLHDVKQRSMSPGPVACSSIRPPA